MMDEQIDLEAVFGSVTRKAVDATQAVEAFSDALSKHFNDLLRLLVSLTLLGLVDHAGGLRELTLRKSQTRTYHQLRRERNKRQRKTKQREASPQKHTFAKEP